MVKPPLRTVPASDYLEKVWGIRRTPGTLRRMRTTGGGPAYLKMPAGDVLYPPEKLDAWAEANLSAHNSTASYAHRATAA